MAPEAPAADAASFELEVPADAKVYVNDKLTTSTCTKRQYVSRNLVAGRTYTFNVRVELDQDGETLTRTETVRLNSGKATKLAIDFSQNDSEEAVAEKKTETKLTLEVPADAKVYLSGRLTSTPGAVRDFTTTHLAEGAQWENYVVRVVLERDGKVETKEETLTLVGGANRELSFNFDEPRVALADR